MVYRVYVEKKAEYAVEARGLMQELQELLGIRGIKALRIVQRYDVEGISEELFRQCIPTVFSEPPLDNVLPALPESDFTLAVEYLPGQFDQRADSAAECIQLISRQARPAVASARVYLFEGSLTSQNRQEIEKYLINPVEARKASLAQRQSVRASYPAPPDVQVLEGFIAMPQQALGSFIAEYGLAMDKQDLAFCQDYFRTEGRNPTLTELRMIDTYWSDHCRHTTFSTILDQVELEDEKAKKTWQKYEEIRAGLYAGRADKPQTLMDLATIGAKELRRRGVLKNLDESEEINACSVKIDVDVNGEQQPWLLQFKNETHNHPTEIEPFGGAATCIGGAIRDPLAGRAYVYQAMRVTGAANPLAGVSETLPGKLPQRKLVTTAAAGYSSYGNQIGLATGQVREIYHPGYMAKRMEIGAVLGAVPQANVRREIPQPGDVVILLGGRTGRDGCGGATGSSKAHKAESLEECGAEVQKGNAPVERKLQRLFRNPKATLLIRRCNDFGAGGVAVAIGELADGLVVNLDAVPKKYEGLDGTELAISESQERMAVVVEAADADKFIALAEEENLEATPVATVQAEKRLQMRWRGKTIVDLARSFLNSNGAAKHAGARVPAMAAKPESPAVGASLQERLNTLVADLNHCGQKGLCERFDSTIGAATVLMPFGGKYQLTQPQAMVAKLPVFGETNTVSGMAFGFDAFVSSQSPYTGAYLAVLESLAKLAATGFNTENAYLTFQEYFERLGTDPARWGKPLAALLGALQAQLDFGVAAVGGKDSMSGSFEDLDVPPTLVSFAVAAGRADNVVSPEFKLPGSRVVLLAPAYEADGLTPVAASFRLVVKQVEKLIEAKKALSVYACGAGGIAGAVFQMGLGNRLGLAFNGSFAAKGHEALFAPAFGSFVVELAENDEVGAVLGETILDYSLSFGGEKAGLAEAQEKWEARLAPVFPYRQDSAEEVFAHTYKEKGRQKPRAAMASPRPRALIPVFPGTNCEYDTAAAIERAGGQAEIFVIKNLTPAHIAESCENIAKMIHKSQIIVLPGGFSGGDEPEGSAKLINAFFRAPMVAQAVADLLEQRDGLMLGICNGFQALVKLGLLPFGKICEATPESPTLTFNTIGRHQSMLVRTRVCSALSPWLSREEVGAVHTVAVSNGEGRFVALPGVMDSLAEKGQLATQYIDLQGKPTMDVRFNPSGSMQAVEGITSPDGRILGKMGHTERSGKHLYQNISGNLYQKLFEGGIDYFKI